MEDDVKHTVFMCPRWSEEKSNMATIVVRDVDTKNIILAMLENQEKWNELAKYTNRITAVKEKEVKTLF